MKEHRSERTAIVSFLREGGSRSSVGWRSWDVEMQGYALAFADMIERAEHVYKPREA